MNIGVCTGLDALTAPVAGLDYIEPRVDALLMPNADDEAFAEVAEAAATAAAAGLPAKAVNCFFPGDMKNTGPEAHTSALDAWVEASCRRAAAVGVEALVFGSGGSRRVPEGFDMARAREQMIDNLRRYGPIAAAHGVAIVLEPLATDDTNIVVSVDEGAEIVREAAHPNIRLLVDTFHMLRNGEGPDAIERSVELIAHAHCAEMEGRRPLGTSGEDQRPFLKALKAGGYDGRISLECRWDDLPGELPAAVAEVRKQWEDA